MLIFFIYETLHQDVIKILPTIYQSKKCLEKIGSVWFIYNKRKVISTIYKSSQYNFWWNCLGFSDKVDLTIRIAIFDNIKHRHAKRKPISALQSKKIYSDIAVSFWHLLSLSYLT